MHGMFAYDSHFNSDLSTWNTTSVVDMSGMFFQATHFNSDLSLWRTDAVTEMDYIFDGSGFSRTLCGGQWSQYFKTATGGNGRLGCCPSGTFMAHPNAAPFSATTSCSPCPPTTYSTTSAAVHCAYTSHSCPVNTHAQNGTQACLDCPSGKYTSATGQRVCQSCATGQVSAAGSPCTKCAAGRTSVSSHATCIDCGAGTVSSAGLACTNCAVGKWIGAKVGGNTAAVGCTDCQAGTSVGAGVGRRVSDCRHCDVSVDFYSLL